MEKIEKSDLKVPDAADVDMDGKVTSTDARLTLQVAVNKITKNAVSSPEALDVDGDGKVSSTDARLMLQMAVGKIKSFQG